MGRKRWTLRSMDASKRHGQEKVDAMVDAMLDAMRCRTWDEATARTGANVKRCSSKGRAPLRAREGLRIDRFSLSRCVSVVRSWDMWLNVQKHMCVRGKSVCARRLDGPASRVCRLPCLRTYLTCVCPCASSSGLVCAAFSLRYVVAERVRNRHQRGWTAPSRVRCARQQLGSRSVVCGAVRN